MAASNDQIMASKDPRRSGGQGAQSTAGVFTQMRVLSKADPSPRRGNSSVRQQLLAYGHGYGSWVGVAALLRVGWTGFESATTAQRRGKRGLDEPALGNPARSP